MSASRRLHPPAPEILAYLARHPHAQDTLEGIARWWLLEESIRQWMPKIVGAIAQLVELGYLRRKETPDGQIYYQANPAWLTSVAPPPAKTKRRATPRSRD